MNNYNKQLDKSLSEVDMIWWSRFFKNNIDWNVNINQEYKGIDAFLNGKKVQFKLREQYYEDILIEFSHSNGEKGWINKLDQECVYLIFGWRTEDVICIIDWKKLVILWKENQVEWLCKYKIKKAINKNKVTLNIAIPFKEIEKIFVFRELN